MKNIALAIAAHPDDIEFCMAGTLILLKKAGYEIHYMNIANGSCGTVRHSLKAITKIRTKESINAAKIIGAVFHEPLVNDIEIFYEEKLLSKICSIMRKISPEILLVPSDKDYMEDHINAGRLAVSAAFCRGMKNFPVNPPRKPTIQKITIYHAQPFGNKDALCHTVKPDLYVNIETVIDIKLKMLAEHKSQKEWLDKSQGQDSYLETLRTLAKKVGEMSGVFKYAEGWRRHNPIGFCDDKDNPLLDVLKDKTSFTPTFSNF